MADTLTRTVHSRAPKTSDIEIHTSTVQSDSGRFVEIREFVVSLEQYGRGITFPLTEGLLDSLLNGLHSMVDLLDEGIALSGVEDDKGPEEGTP